MDTFAFRKAPRLPGFRLAAVFCCLAALLATATLPARAQADTTAQTLSWTGAGGDGLWSNPANWEPQGVPGPLDAARFGPEADGKFAVGDSVVDGEFGGELSGLTVEAGFAGRIRLEHDLAVHGRLALGDGQIEQGGAALSAVEWLQTGGEFIGGNAPVTILGEMAVHAGVFTTPAATMSAPRLEIGPGGIVRLGACGKLELTASENPLTGDGLLDISTHLPNSLEFTGRDAPDLLAAPPLRDGPLAQVAAPEAAGRVLSQKLAQGEDLLTAAVVDSANGFAYFGTYTSPGFVVKVRLSDFTRVGAINLNTGENLLTSAILDAAGQNAYFGTYTSPGRVVRIDLATFTRAAALTLNSGENLLRAAVLDTPNARAYFTTYTNPARVVRLNLSTFTRSGALTFNTGESNVRSAVYDPAAQRAYFGTYTAPGRVVAVDLAAFSRLGAVTLNAGDNNLTCAALDASAQAAYFGTYTSPGRVARLDLGTFTQTGSLALNTGENQLTAALIEPADGRAYFATYTSPGRLVQLDLATFSRGAALALATGENQPMSAALDAANRQAYLGTYTYPGRVVRVELATFTHGGALALTLGENLPTSAVIDPLNGFAYFGTNTTPGMVVKVRLSDLARIGVVALNTGENSLRAALIEPAQGYAYFGTVTNPGRVVRLDLATFTRSAAITLNSGENQIRSAVLDPANRLAYFGTYTSAGRVVRLDLATFSRTGAVTLPSGENQLVSAVIDPANHMAYFGTNTSPGRVIAVNLSPLARSGALTLAAGENQLVSAVIHAGTRQAYFGTNTSPGRVVQVDLATLARANALTLNSGENLLTAAVLDPAQNLVFFGTNTSPGRVVQVDIATLTRQRALTLSSGENGLLCAADDAANGYAYFATYTSPGIVVKVDLLARVLNTNLNIAYRDIQSAVSRASNNNSLTILAGVFTETVVVNGNLTFVPDAGVTLAGNLTVNNARTLTLNGSLALTGNLTVNGTLNQTAGTFTFSGATAAGGSGTIRLRGVAITGALTAPSGNLNVAGDWVNNGTFNPNNGTLTFNGTTAIGGASAHHFRNVTIAAASTLTAPAGNLNISGNFTNSGAFNHNNGAVVFDGAGSQNLAANTAMVFYDLSVNAGVTLNETVAADNLSLAGTLANLGAITKTKSGLATGVTTFGLAGAAVDLATLGSISTLQVSRIGSPHPNENSSGGGNQILDIYYSLAPNAGANGTFSSKVCLPYTQAEFDAAGGGSSEGSLRLCRWNGSGWECYNRGANSSTATNTVCAEGVTSFSDWVIGQVGPTAVQVHTFRGRNAAPAGGWDVGAGGMLALACIGLWLRKQQGKRPEHRTLDYDSPRGTPVEQGHCRP